VRFDAVRPGIAIYGVAPSAEIANARVHELKPVLEWRTRVSFSKEVPAGTGLSYGHDYRTPAAARIATLPVGYGDGLPRRASACGAEVLVGGVRCPLVGRVTMDQCLADVTALGDRVTLGDDVVLLGRQGDEEIGAEELAARLGTIGYEVVTAISARVPRDVSGSL
jgi:alanine racemase